MICGHLLWTKIQGAELYSANICNICLDLTLHALHIDNKHYMAMTFALLSCSVTHIFDHM